MATANQEHQTQLRQLAELLLAVAGESVTVMKRNAPERALKLKRHDEWGIYLEFLKVMFNLTDRLSALYLPIKTQPQFMDSLEDAVTLQLKNVLEPAFGSGADQTEIMLTVGAAVAESRQTYERYRFLVTEENPAKDEMLKDFGGRVADTMGIAGNAQVSSAATLCASAVIPAIKAILAGDPPPVAAVEAAASAANLHTVRAAAPHPDTWASRSDRDRDHVGERDVDRRRRRSGNSVGTAPSISTRSSPGGHPTNRQTDEPSCENTWRTVCLRGILRRMDILA